MESIHSHEQLRVYAAARGAAARIFRLSLLLPDDERFEGRNQIRRCSRSVLTNIAEAWRRRRYPAAFTSKLIDAEGEAAETQIWLDIFLDCGYISKKDHEELHQVDN